MDRPPGFGPASQRSTNDLDSRQRPPADRSFARKRARMVQQSEDNNQKNDNQQ